MKIQQLTPGDTDAFQELRLFALQECPTAFGSTYAEEVNRPIELVRERLADTDNHVFGAIGGDGKLVGMAVLRREEKVTRRHKAHLFSMYVRPEYQSQGLGRALVEKVIERAGEIRVRQVNLQVVDGNGSAVRLYESCGFQRFGLEKDAFKFGADYFDVAYYALQLVG